MLVELNSPVVHVEAGRDVGEVQHHAFGLARRAGRVDQRQQVVHPTQGVAAAQFLVAWRVVALSDEVPEVAGLRTAPQIDAVVERDDPRDLPARQELEREIELRLLADEQQADIGVAQDVADLIRRAGRVEGHADAARGQDAEVGLRPLWHVAGMDAHHLAGLVPGANQGRGTAVHRLAERPPADRAPPAILLDALGRAIATLTDAFADLSDQMRLRHQKTTLTTSCSPLGQGQTRSVTELGARVILALWRPRKMNEAGRACGRSAPQGCLPQVSPT